MNLLQHVLAHSLGTSDLDPFVCMYVCVCIYIVCMYVCVCVYIYIKSIHCWKGIICISIENIWRGKQQIVKCLNLEKWDLLF